jgi:hypothetical protein
MTNWGVIARLNDNEWSMAPNDVWDFEAPPLHAKVRRGQSDIAFAVDVRNEEIDLRGKWFHQGQDIEFSPSEIRIGTNRFPVVNVSSCETMIKIG